FSPWFFLSLIGDSFLPLGYPIYTLFPTSSGNVFEWVGDWYAPDYYTTGNTLNPSGPDSGEFRVLRGIGYLSGYTQARIPFRFFLDPEARRTDIGFRCVLDEGTVAGAPLPACEVSSFVPQTDLPFDQNGAGPGISVGVYCNLDSLGNQYGAGTILINGVVDMNNLQVSSPNGTLNCTPDLNNPQLLNCTGSALHPGDAVTITVCDLSQGQNPPQTPVCPAFYAFNPGTGMCEYTGVQAPLQCLPGQIAVPGYGCMPDPGCGGCPAGFFETTYQNTPVCIPIGGPPCDPNDPTLCPSTCPPGLELNSDLLCCDAPQGVPPVCPIGYSYDANQQTCLPGNPNQPGCMSVTATVPTCAPPPPDETPPPNVTPPPPVVGCWVTSGATGAPLCVSPCPPNADPNNTCTP
ncbi:MAG: SUMF1/EgtB/PvdO family nonheme iron enzyme, partial [Anaerolineales bacterium]|nr:SUMF1/EgtB/PvdO family nonheme iron enzyme [Anaerolineales bacterium]